MPNWISGIVAWAKANRMKAFFAGAGVLLFVQDRDGAPAVIVALLEVAVCVEMLFADSDDAGPKLQDALKEKLAAENAALKANIADLGGGLSGA